MTILNTIYTQHVSEIGRLQPEFRTIYSGVWWVVVLSVIARLPVLGDEVGCLLFIMSISIYRCFIEVPAQM